MLDNQNKHTNERIGEVIELTEEIPFSSGVAFDAGNLTLKGLYRDEISAHRAKRSWLTALENTFLLDRDTDFSIAVKQVSDEGHFGLTCEFVTACARYAFWRLTNHQAPEAQYLIETGHIPRCESKQLEIATAPDMVNVNADPAVLAGLAKIGQATGPIASILNRLLSKLKN
jgi:hypothetical protein